MTLLLVALAGGMGAAARLVVDDAVRRRSSTVLPLGTMLINVSGSLLLGLLAGLSLSGTMSAEWQLVLGTGFLGGYTTFSTASVETVRLLLGRHHLAALVNGIGMYLLAFAGAAVGLAAGLAVG